MSRKIVHQDTRTDRAWLLLWALVLMFVALLLSGCAPLQHANDDLNDATQSPAVMDDRELIVLTAAPVEPLLARAEAKGYVLKAVHPLAELNDTLVVFRIPEGLTIPEAILDIEAEVPGVTAGAHHLYQIQSSIPVGPDMPDH